MKQEDKDILAHVVIDPDAWDAHQRAHFIAKHGVAEGTRIADANLAAKVKRWKPEYEREKVKLGYKNRKQREAEEAIRIINERNENVR